MLDPQLGHLTWRHGTPLVWGIFVPHFGQTHWLGPPIACLPPPLPLPCPLWLIFPPRPKTCCQIKMWLSFQDSHSFSSSSFFFAESNMFQVLSIALQHLLLLFHGRYRLIWSWPTSRGGSFRSGYRWSTRHALSSLSSLWRGRAASRIDDFAFPLSLVTHDKRFFGYVAAS